MSIAMSCIFTCYSGDDGPAFMHGPPRQNREVGQTAVTVDSQRRRRVAELAQREASVREAGTLGSGHKNG